MSHLRKKSELNLTSSGFFLFNAGLGTGTSYARAMSIFIIQMLILVHFTNLAAQNAAK